MRKKEKEIKDVHEVEAVIKKAMVCRLGMSVDDMPYVFLTDDRKTIRFIEAVLKPSPRLKKE